MGVQVDAIGVLQTLRLVALPLLVEHVQLDLYVRDILCGLAQVVDDRQQVESLKRRRQLSLPIPSNSTSKLTYKFISDLDAFLQRGC